MKSDQFRQRIDDEQVEGWKVKEDGDERVVMYKPNYGTLGAHVLVAILTVWWTLGIGNALYAAYKYFSDSTTKVVRDESAKTRSGPGISEAARDVHEDAPIGSE